jgi:hypothetical protein
MHVAVHRVLPECAASAMPEALPSLGCPVPVGIGGIDIKEFSLAGNEYK